MNYFNNHNKFNSNNQPIRSFDSIHSNSFSNKLFNDSSISNVEEKDYYKPDDYIQTDDNCNEIILNDNINITYFHQNILKKALDIDYVKTNDEFDLLNTIESPLYSGTSLKLSDYLLSLCLLKKEFHNTAGDELIFSLVDSFASFLPKDNILINVMNRYSNRRQFIRFLHESIKKKCNTLSVKEFHLCDNKDYIFIPIDDNDKYECPKCQYARYKKCKFPGCESNSNKFNCNHGRNKLPEILPCVAIACQN